MAERVHHDQGVFRKAEGAAVGLRRAEREVWSRVVILFLFFFIFQGSLLTHIIVRDVMKKYKKKTQNVYGIISLFILSGSAVVVCCCAVDACTE